MIKALILTWIIAWRRQTKWESSLLNRRLPQLETQIAVRFPEETLREAFSECWRHPFDFVAAKYGFSNEMVSAGWDAFSQMEVETPMKGYPDLDVLPELTPDLYLVTSGFRRLQQSKIRALGFEHLFKGIFIDAIDEPERKGKEGIFRSIMAAADLSPKK